MLPKHNLGCKTFLCVCVFKISKIPATKYVLSCLKVGNKKAF